MEDNYDSMLPRVGVGHSPPGFICLTPAAGIPARSDSTVSSASCAIGCIDGGTLRITAAQVDVYNLGAKPIAGEAYITAIRSGGVLVAV